MKNSPATNAKKPGARLKFLLTMLALYTLTGLWRPALVSRALAGFIDMLYTITPILGIVFVALLLINLLLKPKAIKKHLGRDSGARGWFYAVVGGILISGPPYVLYPMLGELKKHGVRNSLLAAILYNRNVKIPFLPPLIYYFGLRYTLVLSIYIILFSVINGLIIERLIQE